MESSKRILPVSSLCWPLWYNLFHICQQSPFLPGILLLVELHRCLHSFLCSFFFSLFNLSLYYNIELWIAWPILNLGHLRSVFIFVCCRFRSTIPDLAHCRALLYPRISLDWKESEEGELEGKEGRLQYWTMHRCWLTSISLCSEEIWLIVIKKK